MITKLQIHPAIGIARLGDSPDAFYLAPELTGALPIQCDQDGNAVLDPVTMKERTVSNFKDAEGRVKRQAARFGVYIIGDDGEATLLKIGDKIQTLTGEGTVTDIKWTCYLANKKSMWYEFLQLEGEHGYAPDHPRRNAGIQGDQNRQNLIIDPGPRTVGVTSDPKNASFARGTATGGRTENFPPPLKPFDINTLGDIRTTLDGRLIVLGGHGCSGSMGSSFADPQITSYANNDNWFDDTSDGPVMAIIKYFDAVDNTTRLMEVEQPAWVIVGYPRYAPQIVDLVTMDDLLYDLGVREFCMQPHIFGTGGFKDPVKIDPKDHLQLQLWRDTPKYYNTDYYPDFNTEIFPIIMRPFNYQWVTNFLGISFPAHEVNYRGDFDMSKISVPPTPPVANLGGSGSQPSDTGGTPPPPPPGNSRTAKPFQSVTSHDVADPTDIRDAATPWDPYRYMRMFIYQSLRQPGEENVLRREFGRVNNPLWYKELMPLLCGDNPITNTLPSKFFRLTDTQLFLLRQWAHGKFRNDKPINECTQEAFPVGQQFIPTQPLTRGVLGNILGGSFCPGGEVGWIMRNTSIYTEPYRIKASAAFVPTAGATTISGNNPFIPPALSQTENMILGMEPGDLTKRSGVPWQSDFNECYIQVVDVTWELWNEVYYPDSTVDPSVKKNQTNITMWWPTHRPMQVFLQNGTQIEWSSYIPQTNDGDLLMVSAWKEFGFVVRNPANQYPAYYEVERNPAWIPQTDN